MLTVARRRQTGAKVEAETQATGRTSHDIDDTNLDRNGLMSALEGFQVAVSSDANTVNDHIREFVATIYQQFQYEEYLMESSKYPLEDIHTMEHNRIISTIIYALTNIDNCCDSAAKIIERLRVVFRVHSENFDKAVFEYFKRKHSC